MSGIDTQKAAVVIDARTREAIRKFSELQASIQAYSGALSGAGLASATFAGRAKNIKTAVVKGMIDPITEATAVLTRNSKGFREVALTIKDTSEKTRKALRKGFRDWVNDQNKLANKSQQDQIKNLQDLLTARRVHVKNQNKLAEERIKNQEKTQKTLRKGFRNWVNEQNKLAEESRKGRAKELRDLIAARKVAVNQFKKQEEEQRKVRERASRRMDARRTTRQVVGSLGGIPEDINPRELAAVQRSLAGVSKLIETGKISGKRLRSVLRNIQRGGKATFSGIEADAEKHLRTVINRFNEVGSVGTRIGKQVTLAWSSVFRIAQVQVFHAMLGRVIHQMTAAIDRAAEFELKISQIKTISDENQRSTSRWAVALRSLSDEFNVELIDAAEGAYRTLSNQVAQGARATIFMADALKFAKVTVSTTEEAVNLLSSVINAYNMQVEDASEISAVLFKTIELGRVLAGEMGDKMGILNSMAATLGVRFEEVTAAISVLTRQGVKFNVSQTLINNMMMKLAKPTEKMKELFREWGVESGDAAVATFGFIGVLQKLEREIKKGGLARGGELLGTIRAVRGVVGLTRGSIFDEYVETFDEMTNATRDLEEAQKLVVETSGFKFQQQMNKIQNVLTEDFGRSLIEILMESSKSMGGFDNVVKQILDSILVFADAIGMATRAFSTLVEIYSPLIPKLDTLTSIFVGASAGLLAFKLGTRALNSEFVKFIGQSDATRRSIKSMASSLLTVPNIFMVVGAGIMFAINQHRKWRQEVATIGADTYNRLNRESEDYLKSEAQRLKDEVRTFNEAQEDKLRIFRLFISGMNRAISDNLEGMFTVDSDLPNRMIHPWGDFVDALKPDKLKPKDLQSTILKDIESSAKLIEKIHNDFDDRELEISLKGLEGAFQPLDTLRFRIRNIQDELNDIAIGDDSVDKFRDGMREIEQLAKRINDEIDRGINASLTKTDNIIDNISQRRFELSMVGQSDSQQRQLTEQRISQLRKDAERLFEAGDADRGRSRLEESLQLAQKITQEEIRRREELADKGVHVSGDLKGAELEERIFQQMMKNEEKHRVALEERRVDEEKIAEARIAFEREIQDLKQEQFVNITNLVEAQDEFTDAVERTTQAMEDLTKRAESLRQQQSEAKSDAADASNTIAGNIATLEKASEPGHFAKSVGGADPILLDALSDQADIDSLVSDMDRLNSVMNDSNSSLELKEKLAGEVRKRFREVASEIRNLDVGAALTRRIESPEEEQAIRDRLLSASLSDEHTLRSLLEDSEKNIDQLLENLDKVREGDRGLETIMERQRLAGEMMDRASHDFEEVLERYPDIFEDIKKQMEQDFRRQEGLINDLLQDIEESLPKLQEAFEGIEAGVDIPEIRFRFEDNLAAVDDNTKAIRDLATVMGRRGNALPAATGGLLGGPPGRDNQLIWAHAGEFVVNSKAAKKFHSQLVAMNSGQHPRNYATGGQVTNVNVGDINVQSQPSVSSTVRDIGHQIRREMRRGTLRI